jgi:RiboL-PSP-HEPN
MVSLMNNVNVQQILDACANELNQIKAIIDNLGQTSNPVPFLTKYSIIRACGAIEVSYKNIVADYCSWRSKPQVKNYIDSKVRESSRNPSYSNICQLLEEFDSTWNSTFKTNAKALPDITDIQTSLDSLVDARNEFSHGGNPTITIGDIIAHFTNSRKLVELIDAMLIP